MIGVEWRQIVAVAAAERGVFLEQSLLDIEAEGLGLVIAVTGLDVADRKLVDLAVLEQHVEQCLAAIFGLLGQQFLGPDLLDLEALGKFHELPEIGL